MKNTLRQPKLKTLNSMEDYFDKGHKDLFFPSNSIQINIRDIFFLWLFSCINKSLFLVPPLLYG